MPWIAARVPAPDRARESLHRILRRGHCPRHSRRRCPKLPGGVAWQLRAFAAELACNVMSGMRALGFGTFAVLTTMFWQPNCS